MAGPATAKLPKDLQAGELSISVSASGDCIRLDWSGRSNHRDPSQALAPFFAHVLATAEDRAVEIEMHFERLAFFNSSTISALIQFLRDVRAKLLRVTVVFDGQQKWQKLSFEALRTFETADGGLRIRAV